MDERELYIRTMIMVERIVCKKEPDEAFLRKNIDTFREKVSLTELVQLLLFLQEN